MPYDHPANTYRLQQCQWCEHTRAPHIDLDIQQGSFHFFTGVLVGQRAAGILAYVAEVIKQLQVVDLDHDPIRVVRPVVTLKTFFFAGLNHFINVLGVPPEGVNRKSKAGDVIQDARLGLGEWLGGFQHLVEVEFQRTGCGNCRIKLTQRACSCISRVEVSLLTFLFEVSI